MALQIYSTLTRKKEPFHRPPDGRVKMYVCGPTVYKPAHIGHMVGPVIFDTIKRYLTYLGYHVTWAVNITDVDDKLIEHAIKQKTTVPELAERMTADYLNCLKLLNVTGVDHFPRATQHIPGMVAMIGRLIAKGFAYASEGDVYFDVSKDPDYGKLCNRDAAVLETGAEPGGKKRNPGDFALWKGAKPGEPPEVQFDSPWGKGRPGWHIECSVMCRDLLGETIDIHGGGLDLQFPHHENELAQSESDSGHEFAKVWMHNGLLKLRKPDGKEDKMAGSLGNVLNVADAVARGISGDVLRFFLLSTHYRSPIDLGVWDPQTEPLPSAVVAAKSAHDTFVRFAERVERVLGVKYTELHSGMVDASATRVVQDNRMAHRFHTFMLDDFNTGGAIGVLFEMVGKLNKLVDEERLEHPGEDHPKAKAEFLSSAVLLKDCAGILGLTFAPTTATLGGDDQLVAGLMQLLIDLRASLRTEAKGAAKDNPLKKALFDQTDLIRARLADLGVTLEDRPTGTTWRVG